MKNCQSVIKKVQYLTCNIQYFVVIVLLLLTACNAQAPSSTSPPEKPVAPSTIDANRAQATTIARLSATETIAPALPAASIEIPPTPTPYPTPAAVQISKFDPAALPDSPTRPSSTSQLSRFTTSLGAKEPFTALAYTPVHNVLALATEHEIWLWDMTTGQRIQTVYINLGGLDEKDIPQRGAASLAWSPDGKKFAAGSMRGVSVMWRWDTPNRKLRPGGQPFQASYSQSRAFGSKVEVAFSPDNTKLAALGNDGIINIWDSELYYPIADFTASYAAYFCWSPDNLMLVDDYLTIHHLNGSNSFSFPPARQVVAAVDRPAGVAWSPDSKTIAVSSPDFGLGRITAPPPQAENIRGFVQNIIALAPLSEAEQKAPRPNNNQSKRVVYSPDSQWIAVANSPETGKITLWDNASGDKIIELEAAKGAITAINWPFSGIIMVAASDGTAKILQLN